MGVERGSPDLRPGTVSTTGPLIGTTRMTAIITLFIGLSHHGGLRFVSLPWAMGSRLDEPPKSRWRAMFAQLEEGFDV
ncbi:hypothetical protein GCM10009856_14900 [Mycolicibacterium llatzerense]